MAESRCFDQILGLDATLPAFLLAQIATKQMEKKQRCEAFDICIKF